MIRLALLAAAPPPHWAEVQRMRDDRRAAYLAALIDDFADELAPEFAARVRERDRWLDELGAERRTFPLLRFRWPGALLDALRG